MPCCLEVDTPQETTKLTIMLLAPTLLGGVVSGASRNQKDNNMFFLFYQRRGGAVSWECALAPEREKLVNSGDVEFVSVLDVDNSFTQQLTAEELAAVKYSAPYGFYADFDSDDIEEVLVQSRVFLLKLQKEHDFDISQARLWFTGGRGCHVEIPLSCFLAKVPSAGIAYLPAIFKEIAMQTYVNTLDLRVYTAKKGRMWRTPNFKRSNGRYKVQVTVDEFMSATPEEYEQICSAPRAALPITPPRANAKLALLYALAKEKVEAGAKKRKTKKVNHEQMSRFGGNFPDSVRLLMTGEGVRPGVGWNQIALQLAAFALALGKTEDQTVEEARGLIDTHAGDSDRYGTPRKREAELRNQYRYQDGNPGYEFSLGGVKSLFAKGAYSADLDWAGTVERGEDDEPAPQPTEGEGGGEGSEAAEGDEGEGDEDDLQGALVDFGKNGIFAITEDGTKKICPIGISKPCSLVTKDGKHVGFEFVAHLHGEELGPAFITLSSLKTKSSFNEWVNQFATWQNVTDLLVGHLLEAFRRRTNSGRKKMILTTREGVDLIIYPGAKNKDDVDVIFASPDRCLSPKERTYRFRGQHDEHGAFKSDLLDAPALEDNEETRAFFDNLFKINVPATTGKIIGWFSACFLTQIIRYHWKAFPLLQVWGQAGAGKTQTVELILHLHYYLREPKKIASAGNTFFPMMTAVTQSASIPVVFEELKPRQMAKYQLDQVQNLLRTNYNGDKLERGGINRDSAGGGTIVNSYQNVAPIMFMGEAIESQSAILERCVSAPMSKEDRAGRSEFFDYCYSRRQGGPMAALGRKMIDLALSLDLALVRDKVEGYRSMFRGRVGREAYEDMNRPWHNYSVILTGLDFLGIALEKVFGDRYQVEVDTMKEAVIENALTTTQKVISEAAKVLDVMGQLTRAQDMQYKLERNFDYCTDGTTVDIKLRPAYAKYVRYQLSLKQEVLFDNSKAFEEAMKRYTGLVTTDCTDSPIYRNPYEPLYRFSCDAMQEDGCEPFEE